MLRRPVHVIVMGVSATGKSTVAKHLADELDLEFIEGDDYHPATNLEKMSEGRPLTDKDRLPWLTTLAGLIAEHDKAGRSTVVTCSALRRTYRDLLRSSANAELFFVHLHASFEVLSERMASRRGHFMPTSLLKSQFETLEALEQDEAGAVVDVAPPLDQVVAKAESVVRRQLTV